MVRGGGGGGNGNVHDQTEGKPGDRDALNGDGRPRDKGAEWR